ncbi:MAG: hypothetical protein IKR39_03255 [Lachnospiraceae bacterium]|nr:hypothetical protein [Lachnospiraceae bacterium]
MSVTEIVLLVIGGLFFGVSFFLPDGKKKEEEHVTKEEIKKLIDEEMATAKSRIDDMVDETVLYSVEKAERALEEISNKKIMAVDEYSETVLNKINVNHDEAVFLYDMLNSKDEKLKTEGQELQNTRTQIEAEKKELEDKKRIEEEAQKKADEVLKEALKVEEEKKPEFVPFVPERLEIVDGVAVPVKKAEDTPVVKTTTSKPRKKASKDSSVPVHFESDNDGRKNSNEMIRKLHSEGMSNMQIARELGLGVGEVKLVIDLFVSQKEGNS